MMFRIYRCYHCRYIGYVQVESKHSDHKCALCGKTIHPSEENIYASKRDEARRLATQQAMKFSRYDRPQVQRGLGVRKRVLNIVTALIEMNRMQPVDRSDVIAECNKADITESRAEHFLSQLAQEDIVQLLSGNRIALTGGMV
jgi:hypothetical protein